jgi:hypothetical protein
VHAVGGLRYVELSQRDLCDLVQESLQTLTAAEQSQGLIPQNEPPRIRRRFEPPRRDVAPRGSRSATGAGLRLAAIATEQDTPIASSIAAAAVTSGAMLPIAISARSEPSRTIIRRPDSNRPSSPSTHVVSSRPSR